MKTWKDLRWGETYQLYSDQVCDHIITIDIGKYAYYPKSIEIGIHSESDEYGYPLPRTSDELSTLIDSLQLALIVLKDFEHAVAEQEGNDKVSNE